MSPIPLGIWATAGAGAAGGTPAYELISSTILTSGQSTVTFSSIPSTYKHLQIRTVAKSSGGANVYTRFNGDSGSNYSYHSLNGYGSSVASNAASSQPQMEIYMASSTTNSFTAQIIDIYDYAGTKNKTLKSLTGFKDSSSGGIALISGMWNNTSAITSISFVVSSGESYVTGSRLSLYGIKGA